MNARYHCTFHANYRLSLEPKNSEAVNTTARISVSCIQGRSDSYYTAGEPTVGSERNITAKSYSFNKKIRFTSVVPPHRGKRQWIRNLTKEHKPTFIQKEGEEGEGGAIVLSLCSRNWRKKPILISLIKSQNVLKWKKKFPCLRLARHHLTLYNIPQLKLGHISYFQAKGALTISLTL